MSFQALGRIGFLPGPRPFASAGGFIGFRYVVASRTITPYLYDSLGIPGSALSAIVLAATPAIASVLITHAKRTSGQTYVLVHVTRTGVADDTVTIYDVSGDSWTAEIVGRPSGVDDIGNRWLTETTDAHFYQAGSAGGTFYLRRLSVDGLTDVTVGSTPGGGNVYHILDDTVGAFTSGAGQEIETDGTVTDPTAYDETGVIFSNRIAFSASNPTAERIMFRTVLPLPYRIDISGADLTQVSRSSGWVPSGQKSVALNDEATAFGIFPFDQTASPPSESLDWIDVLPKTVQHASSVEIRPVDYVSPGSPGTLAELPDAVIPLGAAP